MNLKAQSVLNCEYLISERILSCREWFRFRWVFVFIYSLVNKNILSAKAISIQSIAMQVWLACRTRLLIICLGLATCRKRIWTNLVKISDFPCMPNMWPQLSIKTIQTALTNTICISQVNRWTPAYKLANVIASGACGFFLKVLANAP